MTSIAGGHGEANPNSSWLSARGFWLAYLLGLLSVHLLFLSVPFVSIPWAWTATNLLHNAVSAHGAVEESVLILIPLARPTCTFCTSSRALPG